MRKNWRIPSIQSLFASSSISPYFNCMNNSANPHILVVDDDPDILELLRYNLTKEGYRVDCATDGDAALRAFPEVNPDLILLDLMMPRKSGLDVARQLQSDPKTSSVPIIMLTAKGEESDIVIGLELGASDYIVKPFSMRVLLARIRSALRRSNPIEIKSQSSTATGLEILSERFEARINGVDVGLTATEFRLLQLLNTHPGRVFTRNQLVNSVRGESYAVTDRSVDVHITSLRKKLGNFSSIIETVRGVGYRRKD